MSQHWVDSQALREWLPNAVGGGGGKGGEYGYSIIGMAKVTYNSMSGLSLCLSWLDNMNIYTFAITSDP